MSLTKPWKLTEICPLLVMKCIYLQRQTHTHTHIQLKHCITNQSSEENSCVFTFLYNIHCTHSESETMIISFPLNMKALNYKLDFSAVQNKSCFLCLFLFFFIFETFLWRYDIQFSFLPTGLNEGLLRLAVMFFLFQRTQQESCGRGFL